MAASTRAQLLDVALRLLGAADVGPADDLEQRHAGAVVVDERVVGVVDAAAATDVLVLPVSSSRCARVDADARAVDVEVAVDRDRRVVLRRLVVLRHVRVEVVLPVEDRPLGHVEVERLGDAQRVLDRLLVQHRQRTGQAEAHRAHVRVRLVAELVRAPAEQLARGRELARAPRAPSPASYRSRVTRSCHDSVHARGHSIPTRFADPPRHVRNGVTLAYVREGVGGVPLLLLHG